jgi:hypothetical protein
MARGAYRFYFHIPFTRLGIKIASFGDKDDANRVCIFFTAIVMNILERKRYQYYVLKKPMKQWGRIWTCRDREEIWFNPTYFTCGLFNIVHHCSEIFPKDETDGPTDEPDVVTADSENVVHYEPTIDRPELQEHTGYMVDDLHNTNFAKSDKHPLCIDYGDFNISRFNNMNVRLIDYR